MKITKRNILYFILGIVTMFIIDLVWNWEQNINDFKQGFKDGIEATEPSNDID